MNGPAEADPVYERFQLIANGPALFNAVVTGLELDIFHFLSGHDGATFDEIQQFAGLAPHKLRVLLMALCATELVNRRDGRYANSAFADAELAPHGADNWRDILVGWQKIYYPAFAHMTTALREGTNATALSAYAGTEPTLYQRLAHHPEEEAILHHSMAAFTLKSMSGLLDHADLSAVRHLLDVGGGDGTTARALAGRYPDLRITLFDTPTVAGLAGDAIPPELAARIALHPGDLFGDPFQVGADAILFSHVLEVFSPEEVLRLLAKAVGALPAGGQLLVYGFNATGDEAGGVFAARLSLYLNILATGQGMTYPAQDYENWLRQAGCRGVKTFTGLPYEHGLTVGVKP